MPKKRPKKLKKSFKRLLIANSNNSYLIVNLTFAGILLLMLIYSGIFSANGFIHPIKSASIQPSISTGLSRAFSEIVRLNFEKALAFNPYSVSIFSFFFIQLIFRIAFSGVLLSTRFSEKLIIITDILASVLLFLLTFYGFIKDQF